MPAHSRSRLAIYLPFLMGGGAEAVGLWMIQALCDRYAVTIFTVCQPEFDRLNRFYGTSLSDRAITVQSLVPAWGTAGVQGLIANWGLLRKLVLHLVLRQLKQQNSTYDLVISAYNAADLGVPGLQYIHWVRVIEDRRWNWVSGFTLQGVQQNRSLTNSQEVANAAQKAYNLAPTVLYPPVSLRPPPVAWGDRDSAFLCSGRIVRAKQVHEAIGILQRVRQAGYPVTLHITGGGGGVYEWRYARWIRHLVRENADWVSLHEHLDAIAYADLMAHCRYGLHLKKEPFGIAIAEMVKAGLLPFVRDQGGQAIASRCSCSDTQSAFSRTRCRIHRA